MSPSPKPSMSPILHRVLCVRAIRQQREKAVLVAQTRLYQRLREAMAAAALTEFSSSMFRDAFSGQVARVEQRTMGEAGRSLRPADRTL